MLQCIVCVVYAFGFSYTCTFAKNERKLLVCNRLACNVQEHLAMSFSNLHIAGYDDKFTVRGLKTG